MGVRTNASSTDFSDILPEEVETAVKEAAGLRVYPFFILHPFVKRFRWVQKSQKRI